VNQEMLRFGYHTSYKSIDRALIEAFGPMGLSFFVSKTSNYFSSIQTGNVFDYLLYMFIGLMTLIVGLDFAFSFFDVLDPALIMVVLFLVLFESFGS